MELQYLKSKILNLCILTYQTVLTGACLSLEPSFSIKCISQERLKIQCEKVFTHITKTVNSRAQLHLFRQLFLSSTVSSQVLLEDAAVSALPKFPQGRYCWDRV